MIDYKEYDLDYSSFIGGWYMPEKVCDELIDLYNNNKSALVPGTVGWEAIEDENVKKSTELIISPQHFKYIDNYLINLENVLEKYKEKYPHCSEAVARKWSIWMNVKIQHYKPGEGFKAWHAENSGTSDHKLRHLVFMTYLNTVENAGTEFHHQGIKTPCQKGLTLIWPSAWTHTHRGVISNIQEKTIITGWYDFHPDGNTHL